MSFVKLKDSDIVRSIFTAHPSYTFNKNSIDPAVVTEDLLTYIFSSSQGQSRVYSNINGEFITGSYSLSGSAKYINKAVLSTAQKVSLNRVRSLYFSSSFEKPENYSSASIYNYSLPAASQSVSVLMVPQVLFGSEIKPGSVYGLVISASANMTVFDDGFGGLFSASTLIGSVFYQHGIISFGTNGPHFPSTIVVGFSGTNKVPTTIYLCKVPKGEFNFSTNPSYTLFQTSSGKNEILTSQPKTFITSVGLYDDKYNLVGVAKVSTPILNEEEGSILFRLKLAY